MPTLRGIRFANGSELSIGEIEQLTGMGTNGNDSLVGDGSNNYLRGLAGNDTLNAVTGTTRWMAVRASTH
jgi:Ca2+-binding RTX toxin-like protein